LSFLHSVSTFLWLIVDISSQEMVLHSFVNDLGFSCLHRHIHSIVSQSSAEEFFYKGICFECLFVSIVAVQSFPLNDTGTIEKDRVFPVHTEVGSVCKLPVPHVLIRHLELLFEHLADALNDRQKLFRSFKRIIRVFSTALLAKSVGNVWLARPEAFLSPLTPTQSRDFDSIFKIGMGPAMSVEVVELVEIPTLRTAI
jgi:hypothetical protein